MYSCKNQIIIAFTVLRHDYDKVFDKLSANFRCILNSVRTLSYTSCQDNTATLVIVRAGYYNSASNLFHLKFVLLTFLTEASNLFKSFKLNLK